MLRQQRDVFTPLAQRRERDREDIEPVVEIVPEAVLPNFLGEVAIGGRDDTHVDVHRPRAAQSLELPFLKDAQQLGLKLNRQITHFVEEQRSAMRNLEATGLTRVRACERPALASKQLALDQRWRQRRAVERNELP